MGIQAETLARSVSHLGDASPPVRSVHHSSQKWNGVFDSVMSGNCIFFHPWLISFRSMQTAASVAQLGAPASVNVFLTPPWSLACSPSFPSVRWRVAYSPGGQIPQHQEGEVWEDSMAQETVPVSSQRSCLALTLSFENLSSGDIFQNPVSSQILKMATSEEPVTHCGSHWILLLPVGFTFSFCCLLPFSLLFNSPLMGHKLQNSTSNANIKTASHEAEAMAQLVKMLAVQVWGAD